MNFERVFHTFKAAGPLYLGLFYEKCMKALNPVRKSDMLLSSGILWELLSLAGELTNGWNRIQIYHVSISRQWKTDPEEIVIVV